MTSFEHPRVEVVLPVYKEERALAASVDILVDHLRREFPFSWRVTIADNASVDETPLVAAGLAASYDEVESLRVERKGRGFALRSAWLASEADVVSYMDVDLSTN